MHFYTQYSLCLAQLHLFLFLLQQIRQLGVALRYKVQDQFTAIVVKHPCCSTRETQGLQGKREKHRSGHTYTAKQDPAIKYVVFILYMMLYEFKQNNAVLKVL